MAEKVGKTPPGLFRLARLHGVQTRYRDNLGNWQSAEPEALQAVLASMGVEVASRKQVAAATEARQEKLDRRLLAPATPVRLAGEQEPPTVRMQLPESWSGDPVVCRLRTEDGRVREWRETPERQEPDAGRSRSGRPARIHLPTPLPPGYHDLRVTAGETVGRTRVLAAPSTTWRPDAEGEDSREWGVFLPLYALRSERSWGVGDFRDLERLQAWTERLGGDVVGTLPLLSGAEETPADARVYSPLSRLFWNEVYIDVEGAPGLRQSERARRILESADFRAEIRTLRDADLVDWRAAVETKRRVLEPLADDLLGSDRRLPGRFRSFLRARPEVETYARFRSVRESRGPSWEEWPEGLRQAPLESPAGDDGAFRYHLYAQWLAERQMRRLGESRGGSGAGLYLDLPVGSDARGFDVWSNPDLFAAGAAVGSPPDDFFSEGQNWGFPPPRPDAMERTGFAYTIASIRQSMRFASRLRLDHVMGLHRLFWIPDGMSAGQGVYVRYPHEALYAVLCIESHRHRTVVVGEDLGTVPRSVRRTMRRHRMERMYVAQFQVQPEEQPALPRPPKRAVASLNTHDTATFAGFWEGADLEVRRDMGLLEPDELERERARREIARSAWVRFLQERDDASRATSADAPGEVLRASLRQLARSRASLLLVNLEDLWLEERPQNVPGSGPERSNFRRKARLDLEEMTGADGVVEILEEVDRLRDPGEASAEGRTESDRASAQPTERDGEEMSTEISGTPPTTEFSLLTDDDLHLFNEGSHFRLHEKLGGHRVEHDGVEGGYFAVWAPNARDVRVIGDFNDWNEEAHPLRPRGESGIWEGFLPDAGKGTRYKYHIRSRKEGYRVDKADPFAVRHETPPRTASVLWDLEYEWGDDEWMEERGSRTAADAPVSIYELHPGSWRRVPEEDDRPLTYRELAPLLSEYLEKTGFTHVELLPVTEHPFYGSWGYQTTGYFAPTARYGTPQDFMYLVDHLHQEGFGVILDWVPSHFPNDEHGLAYFDGTHLFEHADPREGFHPDWKSHIFNYGRHEVQSFLISSALYWLDAYHIDGIRVDAVASMLYRDYGRNEGEWIPNEHGGRENLEAIGFLRRLNEEIYRSFPDTVTMAEESTAWPMVSRPTYVGGLGFGMKWDMGWMHDTLEYLQKDPVHRRFHHDDLTFRRVYAFSENFVLPLSHDEVVHGKGSLVQKMPGDDWQQRANLRLLLAYQTAQPGKKLLFMGGEFGQRREWAHDRSLDWDLLDDPAHAGIQRWTADLNRAYREEPALHELDFHEDGFAWIDANDSDQSVLTFLRRGRSPEDLMVVAFNFTPVPRENYRIGVPRPGRWTELLNSDAETYGGSGRGNLGEVEATPVPFHGRSRSLVVSLPPLAAIFLKAPPSDGDARWPPRDGGSGRAT